MRRAQRHGQSLTQQRVALTAVTGGVLAGITILAMQAGEFRIPGQVPTRGPLITEVASSNASVLADENGDFPDWVELHNPTEEPIDLDGYFLSDDDDQPARWEFPPITIEPQDHLVVFASGKDRVSASGELHTDFSIQQDGEPILLVEPDGSTVADRLPPVSIPRDASFGRDPGAMDRTCLFAFPTPGDRNVAECFDDHALGAPTLSQTSGFYADGFELTIVPEHEDAQLVYTLDGSYPDLEENPHRTQVYDGPILIDDRSGEPNTISMIETTVPSEDVNWSPPTAAAPEEPIQKGTVVRARTTHSRERTATYFVGPDLLRDDLPVLSLALDEEFLFDHDDGIYVAGSIFEEYRDSEAFNPDRGWRTPANYFQRGRAWERPPFDALHRRVVFEHCAPGGDCDYQTALGVRLHGNLSRHLPQKSFRLYARNDYEDRTFNYPFFDDQAPSDHRRLLLRNSGNDARRLLFLDGYLQSLMTDFHADTQAYRPAVLFINGEYWGIHNIRERYDRHYLEAVHGADADNVVILGRDLEVETGSTVGDLPFRRLLEYITTEDPLDPVVARRVEEEIDLESFFDFVIAHVVVGNWDWPGNNVRLWREPDGPQVPGQGTRDGRWRWLVFDLDLMGGFNELYNPEYDVFQDRFAPTDDLDVQDGYPAMFHRLMRNRDIRERFLTRFADHLNVSMHPDRTVPELDALETLLQDEIVVHAERWDSPDSPEAWHAEVDELRAFMQQRPAIQREQLVELFTLPGTFDLQVTADVDAGGVAINTLGAVTGSDAHPSSPSSWTGAYFQDVPVRLEATPREGYRFVGWEGLTGAARTEATIEFTHRTNLNLEAVFEAV